MKLQDFMRFFTNEEKDILNRVLTNADVSRKNFLSQLNLCLDIYNQQLGWGLLQRGEFKTSSFEALYSKILDMKEEDWDSLKNYLPFQISFDDADVENTDMNEVVMAET